MATSQVVDAGTPIRMSEQEKRGQAWRCGRGRAQRGGTLGFGQEGGRNPQAKSGRQLALIRGTCAGVRCALALSRRGPAAIYHGAGKRRREESGREGSRRADSVAAIAITGHVVVAKGRSGSSSASRVYEQPRKIRSAVAATSKPSS